MQQRGRRILAGGALALAVVATACGGPTSSSADGVASLGGSTATNTADAKKTDPQQAGLDFARCMREHGVDVPDPQSGAGGMVMIGPGPGGDAGGSFSTSGPPAEFVEADEACRHFLEGLIGDGPSAIDPKEQDRALKFAQCMRDHGVDMPDPDFSAGGIRVTVGGPGSGGVDPGSDTFTAAQKACGSLFGPAGGPGAGGGAIAGGGPVTATQGRT